MNKTFVNYYTDKRVGYIVLNRPEKRNALNDLFVEELKEIFDFAENDKNAKLIVLKSSGDVFCAGADLSYLKKLQNNSFDENLVDSNNLKDLFDKIYNLNKIVIAQVEGHAIAGGGGLATVCDFVFSTPDAKYGFTEVKIGFVPAIISTFIIRKIGETKTKELLLTGDLISANDAKNMNLINFVFDKENIENEINIFTKNICENTSAESLKLTKKLISDVQSMSVKDALSYSANLNAIARQTVDCKKGIASFINKEKIIW